MCEYTHTHRFKELAQTIVGTGNSQSLGQASRLEAEAGANVAVLSLKSTGQTGNSGGS